MSVSYNSSTTTDGLVLCLDAANPKSYSVNVHPNATDIFAWVTTGNFCTLSRDTISSPVGNTPLKMVQTGTDPFTHSYNTLSWCLAPAASGQIWTVSVWVKASAATTIEGAWIFEANSSGGYLAGGGMSTPTIGTNWTRIVGTYTTVNGLCAYIGTRLDGTNIGGTGITVWWDGLQVERGNAASTFNPKYNQNGVNWFDVSGNNNHGVMSTFTGNGAGTTSGYDPVTKLMMFDRHVGVSDATINNKVQVANSISLQTALCTNEMSINLWYKPTVNYVGSLIKWVNSWEVYLATYLVWRVEGPTLDDGTSTISQASNINTWMNITATHNTKYRKFYINGVLQYSSVSAPTAQNTTNPITIGSYGTYSCNGALPYVALYSSILTDADVYRNFSVMRSRFGI